MLRDRKMYKLLSLIHTGLCIPGFLHAFIHWEPFLLEQQSESLFFLLTWLPCLAPQMHCILLKRAAPHNPCGFFFSPLHISLSESLDLYSLNNVNLHLVFLSHQWNHNTNLCGGQKKNSSVFVQSNASDDIVPLLWFFFNSFFSHPFFHYFFLFCSNKCFWFSCANPRERRNECVSRVAPGTTAFSSLLCAEKKKKKTPSRPALLRDVWQWRFIRINFQKANKLCMHPPNYLSGACCWRSVGRGKTWLKLCSLRQLHSPLAATAAAVGRCSQ